MMTDPIADMLTRIRNAVSVRKEEVVLPFSKLKFRIGEILKQEGYVVAVEKVPRKIGSSFEIRVVLKYDKTGSPALQYLKRVSKPGRRVFKGYRDIPARATGGRGLVIISTPQGVMTASEAKKEKLGGEIICEVY